MEVGQERILRFIIFPVAGSQGIISSPKQSRILLGVVVLKDLSQQGYTVLRFPSFGQATGLSNLGQGKLQTIFRRSPLTFNTAS